MNHRFAAKSGPAAAVCAVLCYVFSAGLVHAGDSSPSGAFFQVTYTGNAARLGAVKTDIVVTPDEVSFVCGQASQGISSCKFPVGEACCRRELLNIEAGQTVRFEAVAERGGVWFTGWGGACAQEPFECPWPQGSISDEQRDAVCPGGEDRRGFLVRGLQDSRADGNGVFGCDITFPTMQSMEIELGWWSSSPRDLPECEFQLTSVPCSSPITPETTTTTTTTTTLPPMPDCGDPDGSGDTTSTDALRALQASVGSLFCLECYCDVNGDGSVTATDALAVLRRAVGLITEPFTSCPACP